MGFVQGVILTHSVKNVLYRTATNITVRRDIFNLGSLNSQTAGMSGHSGAEDKLVGLENVQEVYEMVGAELRRFRGAMPTTTVQGEPLADDGSRALLARCRPSASCWRRRAIELIRSKSASASTQSDSTSCAYPGILFFRLLVRWGCLNFRLNHALSEVEVEVKHPHFHL